MFAPLGACCAHRFDAEMIARHAAAGNTFALYNKTMSMDKPTTKYERIQVRKLLDDLQRGRNSATCDDDLRARLEFLIGVLEFGSSERATILLPVGAKRIPALEEHLGVPSVLDDALAWREKRRIFEDRHAAPLKSVATYDVSDSNEDEASALAARGSVGEERLHEHVI